MDLRKQLASRHVDECKEYDPDDLDSLEAEAVLPAESPGSPGSPGDGVMKEAKVSKEAVRPGLMALEAQSDDELLGLPRSQPRRQKKTLALEEARKAS